MSVDQICSIIILVIQLLLVLVWIKRGQELERIGRLRGRMEGVRIYMRHQRELEAIEGRITPEFQERINREIQDLNIDR